VNSAKDGGKKTNREGERTKEVPSYKEEVEEKGGEIGDDVS